jgi:hypothetical protein
MSYPQTQTHMNLSALTKLSGVTALLAGLASAQAQVVIFSENFDSGSLTTPGASLSSYHFGDTTTATTSIVPGVGVGASGGWQTVNTAASGANGFSGVGAQFQDGQATGNTSANLSDYTLSFDVMATAGSLNIQIQSWTLPGFGGTQTGTLNTAPANPGFGNDLPLTSSFTHYSLNLGNTTVFPQNTGLQMNGGTLQFAFQLDNGGPTPYSQTMVIDNLMLTMNAVPEPSSLALCAMSSLGGMWALRRRKA